jgi:hypothetical protein
MSLVGPQHTFCNYSLDEICTWFHHAALYPETVTEDAITAWLERIDADLESIRRIEVLLYIIDYYMNLRVIPKPYVTRALFRHVDSDYAFILLIWRLGTKYLTFHFKPASPLMKFLLELYIPHVADPQHVMTRYSFRWYSNYICDNRSNDFVCAIKRITKTEPFMGLADLRQYWDLQVHIHICAKYALWQAEATHALDVHLPVVLLHMTLAYLAFE